MTAAMLSGLDEQEVAAFRTLHTRVGDAVEVAVAGKRRWST